MKTKKIFWAALTMMCALTTTLVSCDNESETPGSKTYNYWVEMQWGKSYTSGDNEYKTIENELNDVVGFDYVNKIYKIRYSCEDEQLKAACQKVVDSWKNKANSPLLYYTLKCTIVESGGQSTDYDVATFQLGAALITPYVLYIAVSPTYEQNLKDLEARQSELGDNYQSAVKTLARWAGYKTQKSAFENRLSTKGYSKTPREDNEENENAVIAECNSIAEQYGTGVNAVNITVAIVKMNLINNKDMQIVWKRDFPANL